MGCQPMLVNSFARAGSPCHVMTGVIDYPIVQGKLSDEGLVSLYHNSGAFGFAARANVQTIGWIGANDPTIRESAQKLVRRVSEPFAATLARMLATAIALPPLAAGPIWLMPKSHWHYELHFGNRELLEPLLRDIDFDPALLRERNDGSALEFGESDHALLVQAVERLLAGLRGSDFMLAFPGRATLCTVHHHQQLWWQTTDTAILDSLDQISVRTA